jgi:hypothetical protein
MIISTIYCSNQTNNIFYYVILSKANENIKIQL